MSPNRDTQNCSICNETYHELCELCSATKADSTIPEPLPTGLSSEILTPTRIPSEDLHLLHVTERVSRKDLATMPNNKLNPREIHSDPRAIDFSLSPISSNLSSSASSFSGDARARSPVTNSKRAFTVPISIDSAIKPHPGRLVPVPSSPLPSSEESPSDNFVPHFFTNSKSPATSSNWKPPSEWDTSITTRVDEESMSKCSVVQDIRVVELGPMLQIGKSQSNIGQKTHKKRGFGSWVRGRK